jgi:hypothetical protein
VKIDDTVECQDDVEFGFDEDENEGDDETWKVMVYHSFLPVVSLC